LVLFHKDAGKGRKPPAVQQDNRRNVIRIVAVKIALRLEKTPRRGASPDFNVPGLAHFGTLVQAERRRRRWSFLAQYRQVISRTHEDCAYAGPLVLRLGISRGRS